MFKFIIVLRGTQAMACAEVRDFPFTITEFQGLSQVIRLALSGDKYVYLLNHLSDLAVPPPPFFHLIAQTGIEFTILLPQPLSDVMINRLNLCKLQPQLNVFLCKSCYGHGVSSQQ